MADDVVMLAHGAGGLKSAELVRELFVSRFANATLCQLGDAAVLESEGKRLAFTTDAFVIDPVEFPGGDIGKLAVCGTVNDLAAAGACPLALGAAFILEEGLSMSLLSRIVDSMALAADEAGVSIVAGDTKVVPRGSADRLYITTSGIGLLPVAGALPSPDRAAAGDMVLLSGSLAEHGMAIMSHREGLSFGSEIRSDCAPLAAMVAALLEAAPHVHCLRDPTRGGLAAVLNELAGQSGVCIEIDETAIPLRADVRVACELLGIDPLHVANEGKMVVIVPEDEATAALDALRAHRYGTESTLIGRVLHTPAGRVQLRTAYGSRRIIDVPAGDLLPRIC